MTARIVLPLNVSRSALQNDGFVKKISDYIAKKVADKLNGMCKTDRETYEKYWDDINPFIKFGCIKDEKFSDKIMGSVLFKNLEGKYLTLRISLTKTRKKKKKQKKQKKNADNQTEETKEKVLRMKRRRLRSSMSRMKPSESQYINLFKETGYRRCHL